MSIDAAKCRPTCDLKNASLAAFFAWLLPGAGHFYQRRTAKGLLFMVSILGTFFFGMWLGGGHVVYASWHSEDWRLPYLCQVGVGLPALPALVQTALVSRGHEPFWDGAMAPPRQVPDDLSNWEKNPALKFGLGSVYTMVAGLLNILAIYDAYDGPAVAEEEPEEPNAEDRKKGPGGGAKT